MPNDAMTLISALGIRKSFGGVEVLHGVDLHLAKGQVLSLLGENGAGKSTLVKILAGDYVPDAGTISINGQEFTNLDPVKARDLGVRMIFQELNDAPTLTVAENISMGRWANKRGIVSWKKMYQRAEEALAILGVSIDPARAVGSLRVGERQLIEIARALTDEAKVLILDEPTAVLSPAEAERLFSVIKSLSAQQVGMIYITHRLDEVAAISDTVQVLRDGSVVLIADAKKASRSELVSAMIGRDASELAHPNLVAELGETLLEVSDLSSERAFADISFSLQAGEILALYGKVGSGTAEVAESIFGLHDGHSGQMKLEKEDFAPKNPGQAIGTGIGFLPADRQRLGAFMIRPVAENLAVPSWPRYSRKGFITRAKENAAYINWSERLKIRSRRDPNQLIATLSGGNQQKVLLSRWFECDAKVLVLIEPTRGVDVGARRDIYDTLRQTAREHRIGILVTTSDHDEVIQVADRAIVMARGRIVTEFSGDQISNTALIESASG